MQRIGRSFLREWAKYLRSIKESTKPLDKLINGWSKVAASEAIQHLKEDVEEGDLGKEVGTAKMTKRRKDELSRQKYPCTNCTVSWMHCYLVKAHIWVRFKCPWISMQLMVQLSMTFFIKVS